MKLRPKLTLQIAPLVLVPILAFGIFALVQIDATSKAAAQRQSTAVLEQFERQFTAMQDTARANIGLFANSPYLRKYLATEEEAIRYALLHSGLMELFSSYQAAYPEYVEIRVLLPDGYEDARITLGSIPNLTENEGDSDYFEKLKTLDGQTYVDFAKNPDNDQPVLHVAHPLRFVDGAVSNSGLEKLYGYLSISVSANPLIDGAVSLRTKSAIHVHFVDRDGKNWWPGSSSDLGADLVSALLTGTGDAPLSADFDGSTHIFYAKQLHENLIAVHSIPASEFAAAGQRLRNGLVVAFLLAGVGTFALLFWLINAQLIRPITRMGAAAQSMGDGNLRVAISQRSNDEVGQLAETLQDMGNRLFDMRQTEAERAEELRKSNKKLERAVSDSIRARDSAQTASMAKTEFLARMSHEIRTPMNGVLGMTELLRATDLSPLQKRHTDTIHKSGEALLSIINDILDFSKIEAGKLTLERADFSLPHLINDTVGLQRSLAEKKSLAVFTQVSADLSERVSGDPIRVSQILTNLIGNAVKFTERGQISVTVKQEVWDDDGIWTVFDVTDSGVGISQRNIDRIFESFDQADGSTTRRYGGTGLGLAISKQLVDLMGGVIWVNSSIGVGSTFSFRIPLYPPLARTETPSESPPSRAQPLNATILVAEDNPTNLEVAKGMLESLQCEPVDAADGLEAVHQVRRGGVDIVLMDCQMPVMDGFAATEAIRTWELENNIQNPIPIIALTANALEGDRDRCIKAGMDDYLSKPLTVDDLYQKLDLWLNHHPEATTEPVT